METWIVGPRPNEPHADASLFHGLCLRTTTTMGWRRDIIVPEHHFTDARQANGSDQLRLVDSTRNSGRGNASFAGYFGKQHEKSGKRLLKISEKGMKIDATQVKPFIPSGAN
jgi:hypothetical protein